MKVLVTYATKHGATGGIATRIARRLEEAGHEATVQPIDAAGDPSSFDAVVIGSAAYIGAWRSDAVEYVNRHEAALAQRPVWLFSSGPLGEAKTDPQGRDVREGAVTKHVPELAGAIHARDHRVFFGVLDPSGLGLGERAFRVLPAGKKLLPEGDFRDWADIDAWADGIARELTFLEPELATTAGRT